MPKFYVESGNVQLVTHAKNARGAVIRAVHRTMGQLLPFLSEQQTNDVASGAKLGELIKSSERGFGRTDAALHDTFDVVCQWNRLLIALDKLQEDQSSEVTAV